MFLKKLTKCESCSIVHLQARSILFEGQFTSLGVVEESSQVFEKLRAILRNCRQASIKEYPVNLKTWMVRGQLKRDD